MRQVLNHLSTSGNYRKMIFSWYLFQNSITVRDIGLKFDMVVVVEKLEDLIHGFLPGSVQK
jgi:hypothetical protein